MTLWNRHKTVFNPFNKPLITLCLLMVSSCTSEAIKPEPAEIPLRFVAAENLNQGNDKRPLALVLKIYHLRARERFEQVSFDSLLDPDSTEKQLGTDLVDAREILLSPEQHYEFTERFSAETRFLGVVAFFRQPAPGRWRHIYSLQNSEPTPITVGLHACAMTTTGGTLVNQVADEPELLGTARCKGP
jgi:type VI secretion system protein VasD